jgi:hypothetical protein
MRRGGFFSIAHYVAIIVVFSALAFGVAHVLVSPSSRTVENRLRLSGLRQLSETELRNIVLSNHLLVYWARPTKSATYLLDAIGPTAILLTIQPHGQQVAETHSTYPQICTYIQKDAFEAVLAGGPNPSAAGFISSDGNAVFYSDLNPKNAYVGFRGTDVEVQVFDPVSGRSLALVKAAGVLTPIIALKS